MVARTQQTLGNGKKEEARVGKNIVTLYIFKFGSFLDEAARQWKISAYRSSTKYE